METFAFFAKPWWVNFAIAIPIVTFLVFRKTGLAITKKQLAAAAIFGIAFGFIEAAVVIYLRAAFGLTSVYNYEPIQILNNLTKNLFITEIIREVATVIMLVSVAVLAAPRNKERWSVFLWTFAFWDLFYYVTLRLLNGWPMSLLTTDILFLIPVSWISQVWFPLLFDGLSLIAVYILSALKKSPRETTDFVNSN